MNLLFGKANPENWLANYEGYVEDVWIVGMCLEAVGVESRVTSTVIRVFR